MKNSEKKEPSKDRRNNPTIRITAVFTGDIEKVLPYSCCKEAAQQCGKLLAMLGFTCNLIQLGALEDIIEGDRERSLALMSSEVFENVAIEHLPDGSKRTPEDRSKQINENGDQKIKNSKISVEDVMKGIKLD